MVMNRWCQSAGRCDSKTVLYPEFVHHSQPKVGHSGCCCLDFVEGHVLLCQGELLMMARFIDLSL